MFFVHIKNEQEVHEFEEVKTPIYKFCMKLIAKGAAFAVFEDTQLIVTNKWNELLEAYENKTDQSD